MPDFHTSWQDTPIFTKTYELYKNFYSNLSSFPRKDRYTLGQKCEKILLELLEKIILASNISKQEKLPVLREASVKVDLLRVFFKLGKDLKIIENIKYIELENSITEIGKMVGGWIKASNS
ncbi:MAG: S23 ribosomal protein [Candidatus Levybacteria bacterium GW2011_GWC2_37_7]|nr:MAG: S23 ribosomal protein [Candidatus Levybacteria bacterium GW2011_GWC2_37_7]